MRLLPRAPQLPLQSRPPLLRPPAHEAHEPTHVFRTSTSAARSVRMYYATERRALHIWTASVCTGSVHSGGRGSGSRVLPNARRRRGFEVARGTAEAGAGGEAVEAAPAECMRGRTAVAGHQGAGSGEGRRRVLGLGPSAPRAPSASRRLVCAWPGGQGSRAGGGQQRAQPRHGRALQQLQARAAARRRKADARCGARLRERRQRVAACVGAWAGALSRQRRKGRCMHQARPARPPPSASACSAHPRWSSRRRAPSRP